MISVHQTIITLLYVYELSEVEFRTIDEKDVPFDKSGMRASSFVGDLKRLVVREQFLDFSKIRLNPQTLPRAAYVIFLQGVQGDGFRQSTLRNPVIHQTHHFHNGEGSP